MELFYETKFDAAHRLLFHPGKCRNLHGHTWRVSIGISGEPNINSGMIVDFADLKMLAVNLVMQMFDHSTILNRMDTELIRVLEPKYKVFVMDGEPTCENLAMTIFQEIKAKLDKSLFEFKLTSVTVWESDHASARYMGSNTTK